MSLATKSDLVVFKQDIVKWIAIVLVIQTGTLLGFLYFILKK
jgi:hypothetical protein